MGTMESKVVWRDQMAFDVELGGHRFVIDAKEESGGRGLGPSPKGLLMSSLAGCTAMDVIFILRKMRQDVESLEVSVDATLSDEHPKKYESITLTFRVTGQVEPGRLVRAVYLSDTQFCGVTATLRPAVDIRTRIFLNEEELTPEK